jgi:tubulin polyglutamylase TTLL4
LLWTSGSGTEVLRYMNRFQKMNHFPGSYNLGRKDLMWTNISRLKRQFGSDYNICPKTFVFPHDYRRFITEAKENPKGFYILKPIASSCGNGIKVISASSNLPKNKKGHLVSKYISKPHLIKGFKYDMRIYVLVTSYDPLVIYMYKDGLVRFSTEKYSLKGKNFKKRFMHLTNYSVNKKAEKYNKNSNSAENPCDDDQILSKWSYQQLKNKITELGYDWRKIDSEIKDVLIKTIISAEPSIVHQQSMYTKHKNC